MSKERRRSTKRRTIFVAVATAIASISIPAAAAAQNNLVEDVVNGVNGIVGGATGGSTSGASGGATGGGTGEAATDDRAGVPPAYTPPLHGTNPHGQGTVANVDVLPSDTVPLPGTPADSDEDIIVGDSDGGQDGGAYSGSSTVAHVNLLGLVNSPLFRIETAPGETKEGDLMPLQSAVNSVICTPTGSPANCLQVVEQRSSTSTTGSSNGYTTAGTNLTPDLTPIPVVGPAIGVLTIGTGAASSTGDINEAGGCQTATGTSSVANATVGAAIIPGSTVSASALNTSSQSQACSDGTTSQTNSSEIVGLQGSALPLPNADCGNGVANTNLVPPLIGALISATCNADDSNGSQANAPYGVREALTVFLVPAADLLKVAISGPESLAVAPATPTTPTTTPTPTPTTTGTTPGSGGPGGPGSDGPDGPGDGGPGGPGGPVADTPQPGGELAFTGSNLVVLALIGGSLVLAGIALAGTAGRHRRAIA